MCPDETDNGQIIGVAIRQKRIPVILLSGVSVFCCCMETVAHDVTVLAWNSCVGALIRDASWGYKGRLPVVICVYFGGACESHAENLCISPPVEMWAVASALQSQISRYFPYAV